jgi:hypothetical protein
MSIQAQYLIPRLVSEFGYADKEAEEVASDLQACTPWVQAAFKKWWQGEGLDASLEIQGYTLQRLIDEYSLKPIGAFLTMDWLTREPSEAMAALAEGYDLVGPEPRDE